MPSHPIVEHGFRTDLRMRDLVDVARRSFAEAFGSRPSHLGQSPARVELLGNHTDYNGGLVTSAAIDRYSVAVGRALPEPQGRVRSVDLGETDAFCLDRIERSAAGHWSNYVRGVVWALQEAFGPPQSGFEIALAGDVPIGAGLSSSASVQAAIGTFLLASGVFGESRTTLPDDDARMALAHLLRRSENAFVGVASGLLDQFSVLFGHVDHVLSLDCSTERYRRVPFGSPAPAIVVCDSKTSRRLADGMYNRRREECERVVRYFQAIDPSKKIKTLRDITRDDVDRHWEQLDPDGRRRARHVLLENARVLEGNEALEAGDIERFASLLSASHVSSRDDFENSSPALDALIEAAAGSPGFLGGKLSGAGWAGCTVNLVKADQAEAFSEAVRSRYASRQGIEPAIHICRAAEGAKGGVLAR